MDSTNGVIIPESMEDILANPVDICFGSMPGDIHYSSRMPLHQGQRGYYQITDRNRSVDGDPPTHS
jgi:hypothetical protein